MIFVNYGGGGYYFFAHSIWNGLTVADLVFPWFIFIMGSAMSLSFDGLLKKKVSRLFLLRKAVRRSIILFGLGLFMNDGYYINQWRIPGNSRIYISSDK
jgi:heparan-alpha-glucosaminide N-acetyltransferase